MVQWTVGTGTSEGSWGLGAVASPSQCAEVCLIWAFVRKPIIFTESNCRSILLHNNQHGEPPSIQIPLLVHLGRQFAAPPHLKSSYVHGQRERSCAVFLAAAVGRSDQHKPLCKSWPIQPTSDGLVWSSQCAILNWFQDMTTIEWTPFKQLGDLFLSDVVFVHTC